MEELDEILGETGGSEPVIGGLAVALRSFLTSSVDATKEELAQIFQPPPARTWSAVKKPSPAEDLPKGNGCGVPPALTLCSSTKKVNLVSKGSSTFQSA